MTKKAVVLAAGRGGRLERRTESTAKCLVRVAGRPLIDHVLASLGAAGIEDAVVVVGYHGDQVEAHVGSGARYRMRTYFVRNDEFRQGNASSLWRALPLVATEAFLLTMSDHLCSASMFRSFLAAAAGRTALAVDRSEFDAERAAEATKVALHGDLVVDIGKDLASWDGVDTGVSHWACGAFAPAGDEPPEGELAALMARLARTEGGIAACDVTGEFWLDIDTEQDILLAERLLQADEQRLA